METGFACPLAQGAKGGLLVRFCHRELVLRTLLSETVSLWAIGPVYKENNIYLLLREK
jgi:hypothetical protein